MQLVHRSVGLVLASFLLEHATGFAGGGFGTKSSTPAKKPKKKKPSKKATIFRSNDLVEETTASTPQLDKWGLPLPTLEDVFPPLPETTVIQPARPENNYSLDEIQSLLEGYVDMKLDLSFDNNGVERNAPDGVQPMKLHVLHQDPPVLRIDNYLTAEECDQLKGLALTDDPQQVHQVESQTFPGAISKRTSTSWFTHYHAVPTFLAKTQHRLHIPLAHMEEPQLVRYRAGQEFSWHEDQVPNSSNQRLLTLLVYLNDAVGGTEFRDLKSPSAKSTESLCMTPQQGSAMLFFPSDVNGVPDDRTLHRGQPVTGEVEKWIVQMWVHQKDYQAVLPPGNHHQAAEESIHQAARRFGYIA